MTDQNWKSPLRRQWERDKPSFEAQAIGDGDLAVIARALLAFMPALVDYMEGELKRSTRPGMVLEGVTAAISNMAFQAIAATVEDSWQAEALDIVHRALEQTIRPKLGRRQPTGQIIMPSAMN